MTIKRVDVAQLIETAIRIEEHPIGLVYSPKMIAKIKREARKRVFPRQGSIWFIRAIAKFKKEFEDRNFTNDSH